MKKIGLITIILILGTGSIFAKNTVGVFSNFDTAYATLSLQGVEIELGVSDFFNEALNLNADYNVGGASFAIGSAPDFFWNFALGAGVFLKDGEFDLAALFPFEFGYSFPIMGTGLDLYIQPRLRAEIIPSLQPGFDLGLGVRLGL